MKIRATNPSDAGKIADIYNHYVRHTTITFEEEQVSSEQMALRIEKVTRSGLPWLVAEEDDEILGYAYAGQWHERSAYRYTVEPSVYLSPDAVGRGLGRLLYRQLLEDLRQKGIKNVMGVIALPNDQSVGLHESFGFEKVGEFSDVGFKFGKWISVGYWQLKFPD